MPETENGQSREEDLRRLLTDAIEVQLAALKAGIGFWTEWIEQTSEFVAVGPGRGSPIAFRSVVRVAPLGLSRSVIRSSQ